MFLGCVPSPPHLSDDVDAVQAQIARNMLDSGDWVTARLNGVPYLEKSPLPYWMMASSFRVFGVHDWSARLPLALATVLLCWVTARFGYWAFGKAAGMYAGIILATCAGLFLFTRILIPDAVLTLTIALAMWSFLRALNDDGQERRPLLWAMVIYACLGTGLLLKGLIAVVFPLATAIIYLGFTRQLLRKDTWTRLRPFSGILLVFCIAAPWHILATLHNPPYFDWTMHSSPGEYHGFFWFYFLNEHVFRFLNMRYPRDYNTVPRLWFWLLHLVWLFPWSIYFLAIGRMRATPTNRLERTRLLAACWIAFVLVFFSFSTTQEYYSMPIYPALALLLGYALTKESRWTLLGTRILLITQVTAAALILLVLYLVRGVATPGDISHALIQNPDLYTLSLGHIGDLTLQSFAYLRLPLFLVLLAMVFGIAGMWINRRNMHRCVLALAMMMIIFLQAARVAMVAFDPYLSSKPLADALASAPEGGLIEANAYYAFSSVFFYTNRKALLWGGRVNNLEYGSYAPGVPSVFIDDAELKRLWLSNNRYYLLLYGTNLKQAKSLLGESSIYVVMESGGNFLLVNQVVRH